MCEIKKKEIQDSSVNEIRLENEVSLKAREMVFFRLKVEEEKIINASLKKRIKFLVETHRELKK